MSDPTNVVFPYPKLNAGERLAVSGYTRGQVADYGNARAAERDEIHAAAPQPARVDKRVEAALIAEAQALIAQMVEFAGAQTPLGKGLGKLAPIIAALAAAGEQP